MQTQNYFQNLEDGVGRGDHYEGAEYIEQVNWIKLENNKLKIDLSIHAGNFKESNLLRIKLEYLFNDRNF